MKKFILFFLVLCSFAAWSQQVPDLYHYYRYPALINPAAIGMNDQTEIITLYKNQWWGIPDAPQTQLLMVQTPLKQDKLGLGFSFYNDLAHIMGHTGAYTSLSYHLALAEEHKLSFGLSLGAFNSRIFFDKIRAEDPFEASLLNNSESRVKADASAGIRYRWNKFHAGISSEHLLQNKYHFENVKDNKSLFYKLVRHYNFSAGYKLFLNENFSMEPLLLIRSAQGLPSQAELNNTILYKEKIWINLAYRHRSGAGMALGFLVEEKLTVGYHFEHPLTDIRKVSGASHEFALSYRFGKVKEVQHTGGHEKIEKLEKENEEQYEMLDQLEKKTDTLKYRIDQHDEEIKKLKEINKREQQESEKMKKEEITHPSEIKEQEREEKKRLEKEGEDEIGSAHTHLDYYLVLGSFGNIQDAKLYQQVLKREYNLDSKLALSRPIEGKSRFLVYGMVVQDSEDAKKEIKRFQGLDKKQLLQQEPWLYRAK